MPKRRAVSGLYNNLEFNFSTGDGLCEFMECMIFEATIDIRSFHFICITEHLLQPVRYVRFLLKGNKL